MRLFRQSSQDSRGNVIRRENIGNPIQASIKQRGKQNKALNKDTYPWLNTLPQCLTSLKYTMLSISEWPSRAEWSRSRSRGTATSITTSCGSACPSTTSASSTTSGGTFATGSTTRRTGGPSTRCTGSRWAREIQNQLEVRVVLGNGINLLFLPIRWKKTRSCEKKLVVNIRESASRWWRSSSPSGRLLAFPIWFLGIRACIKRPRYPRSLSALGMGSEERREREKKLEKAEETISCWIFLFFSHMIKRWKLR